MDAQVEKPRPRLRGAETFPSHIAAYIEDPATIPTHEAALEVMAAIDREVVAIHAQIVAAQARYEYDPPTAAEEDWLRRAIYARSYFNKDRGRVYHRDRELRHVSLASGNEKEQRARERAERTQREQAAARQRKAEKQAAKQASHLASLDLELRRKELDAKCCLHHFFKEEAKKLLPREVYSEIESVAKALADERIRQKAAAA